MKKFLFLLLAVILPMAISAQLLDNNRDFKRSPYAFLSLNQHQLMTTSRVNLADNQMIMGHYDTDDVASSGQGIGLNTTGKRQVGTVITPEEVAVFEGGKIVKFRVGLANAASISKVLIAKVSAAGAVGSLQQITCSSNAAGWNEITLSSPYTINLTSTQGLFIGFEYQQSSGQYPLSAVQVGDIYPTLWKNGLNWQDLGLDAYGNLSVQCVVESDNFPEYMITVNNLYIDKMIKLGNDIEFAFNTKNMGTASNIAAGACTYNVLIDGELVTTLTNPEAFGKNALTINGVIPSTGLASGKHTFTIAVNTLNGEPVANPRSVSQEVIFYEKGYLRQMHLIEEFTSNSCMWCPLGARFLNTVMALRDDIAMVAIHGNQSAIDPFTTSESETLYNLISNDGWPTASFDRSTGWEDDVHIANGVGYYEQYHQQYAQYLSEFFDYLAESPSFATIHINSTFDPTTRNVVVTVDGDITGDFDTMLGADSKLSVFLTEDGLVYRQNEEGTYIENYVHNHVFRKALGSVYGVDINKVGNNKYSNTFEYTIPSGWKTENMEIVAFISRPLANGTSGNHTDMYVNQANMRKFGEFDEITSIRGDVDGDQIVGMDDLAALINYLLTGVEDGIDMVGADCLIDNDVNMDDLSELINYLLTDEWTE